MILTQHHREILTSALMALLLVAWVLIPIWGPFVLVGIMKSGNTSGGGIGEIVFVVILGALPAMFLKVDALTRLLITIVYLFFGGIAAFISAWASLLHYGYH